MHFTQDLKVQMNPFCAKTLKVITVGPWGKISTESVKWRWGSSPPCIHIHTLSMNATFLCFVTWLERVVFCAVNTALRGGDGTMLKRGLCDQEMWPATISHIRWVCTHWQASYALNLAPGCRRHARMAWPHNWQPHSEMPSSHSNWFARKLPQKLDGILRRIRDQKIGADKISEERTWILKNQESCSYMP
jgi:hypothetical protein